LAQTPVDGAYDRLKRAIEAAPANQITHIMIPFHINTGNFGTGETIIGIRDGATVVLIGNHPVALGGQSVITDTHDGSTISRTFRLRGRNVGQNWQNGLVLRNIVLQKNSSLSAGTPNTAPSPDTLANQTGGRRGGGIAIEAGDVSGVTGGGSANLTLCNGSVIRNNTTDNNGSIDIQTNGRLTMMPGSLISGNGAGNSGGGVNVNTNATFNMYGGIIENNLARGENTNSPTMRGVGGGVLVQNGGVFNLHNGIIRGNIASLASNAANPNATNGIVTSSGGAVFVTGGNSTFNMYNGLIENNRARRTRSSGVGTGTASTATGNRAAYRAGNGGGIYLTDGGTFNMYNGRIHSNTATNEGAITQTSTAINGLNLSNGGGVYLTGANTRFNMHGGIIDNNLAERSNNSVPTTNATQRPIFAGNGGGVHAFDGATFNMYHGQIHSNTATATANGPVPANHAVSIVNMSNGGGVYVAGNNSRFNMEGGSIRDNNAISTVTALGTPTNQSTTVSGNGGGVHILAGARFQMDDGEIVNNSSVLTGIIHERGGGGVYLGVSSTFIMNGGVISNNEITNSTNWQGGGGVLVGGGSNFTMTDGSIADNFSTLEGGGIYIGPQASVRMYGGSIINNYARSVGRGGGGVWVMGGAFTTANPADGRITEKLIAGNRTRGHGGGIGAQRNEAPAFSGFSGVITIVPGTIIRNNEAGIDDGHLNRGGLGGGLFISDQANLVMSGGVVSDNSSMRGGGGVALWSTSTATISDGDIINNHTTGRGGGFLLHYSNSRFTLSGGNISENVALRDGGGIGVGEDDIDANLPANPAPPTIHIQGGTVSNNIGNRGGGIYILHRFLGSLTIDTQGVFTGNVARTGIRIDNTLADNNRSRINPRMVSVIEDGELLFNNGNLIELTPHAFTNYDINADGSQVWRVTYDGVEGAVVTHVGANQMIIPTGTLVPHDTTLTFEPEPTQLFDRWDVGTRAIERDVNGSEVAFDVTSEVDAPLVRNITAHTHVVGYFREELTTTITVSKEVTGEFGNRSREYDFTIYLFGYDGEALKGMELRYTVLNSQGAWVRGDTIVLDNVGSYEFQLLHGQTIQIEEVLLGGYLQVVETPDSNYNVFFIDSEDTGVTVRGNDTTRLPVRENRGFHFINDRIVVPITGVNIGSTWAMGLVIGVISLLMLGMFVVRIVVNGKKIIA
jgi:hypothetical protein